MKCKQVPELIELYLEGKLDVETDRMMHDHITSCRKCHYVVLQWEQLIKGLESEKTEKMKPFFYTRLEHKLSYRHISLQKENVFTRILQPALIGLLLFLSLSMGILIGSKYSTFHGEQSSNAVFPADEFYLNEGRNEIETILLAEE